MFIHFTKMLLLSSVLFFAAYTAKSQDDSKSTTENVFVVVEQMPQFMGGKEALGKFLTDNLKYPKKAAKKGIEGTVYTQFVVDEKGKISEVKVLTGIGYGCDEEAVRVIQLMPIWEAGKQGGKPVAVRFNLPIKFKLAPEKKK